MKPSYICNIKNWLDIETINLGFTYLFLDEVDDPIKSMDVLKTIKLTNKLGTRTVTKAGLQRLQNRVV